MEDLSADIDSKEEEWRSNSVGPVIVENDFLNMQPIVGKDTKQGNEDSVSGEVVAPKSCEDETDLQGIGSKRESIRKRLREKEKFLHEMMKKQSTVLKESTVEVEITPSIGTSTTLFETTSGSTEFSSTSLPANKNSIIYRLDGKEEVDRREAVRLLSLTALELQEKLKIEKNDANRLQTEFGILLSSLDKEQEFRVKIENELAEARKENEQNSKHLRGIENDLEKKEMIISDLQERNQLYNAKELDMQNDLVIWTQKDSLSKVEQIEYLEYQIFAKNNEIDDLKQELNRMLRKVVELEVDLEIHEDRFLSNLERYTSDMMRKQQQEQHKIICEDEITDDTVDDSLHFMNGATSHIDLVSKISIPSKKVTSSNRRGLDGLKRIMSFGKNKAPGATTQDLLTVNSISNYDKCVLDSISRLQTDLDNLEGRYKKDRSTSKAYIEQLKQEKDEYLIKILTLEKSIRKMQLSSNDESDNFILATEEGYQELSESKRNLSQQLTDCQNGTETRPVSVISQAETALPTKEAFLEETVETLKNAKILQNQTIERLRAEIERYEKKAENKLSREDELIKNHTVELETRDLKVAAMERELGEIKTISGSNIDQKQQIARKEYQKGVHINAAARLEIRLKDIMAEVIRLRKIEEVKDKQIDALRVEMKQLRFLNKQQLDSKRLPSKTTK